jgi:hypothetical protein
MIWMHAKRVLKKLAATLSIGPERWLAADRPARSSRRDESFECLMDFVREVRRVRRR